MKLIRFWLLVPFILQVGTAYAAQCLNVFPDPVASYSSNGDIRFGRSARVIGSDGVLTFKNIDDRSRGGRSCDSQSCVAGSNSSANLNLPTYIRSQSNVDINVRKNRSEALMEGSYDRVTAQKSAELTLETVNGTYIIRQLRIQQNATLKLAGGVYWIEDFDLSNNTKLIVTGSEPVTIYTRQADFGNNSTINKGNDAAKFTLISYGSVRLGRKSQLDGFIYATSRVNMITDSQVVGAINAASVRMGTSTRVTYAPNQLQNADFNGACTTGAVAPEPIAHWPIDVCALDGTVGEVLDIVGNNNGQALDGVGVEYDGHFCQAAEFKGTGDVISIPHSDSYFLGQGSVSFWFLAPDLNYTNRPSAGGMGIFSKDSSGFGNGGHLTIWVRADGSLRARHQNTSQSSQVQVNNAVTANTWHFVTYTWGPAGASLYVDAGAPATDSGFTDGLGTNNEPIILGGNAWQSDDGVSPPAQLKDLFKGKIDDVKLFDQQLSQEQVNELFAKVEGSCQVCQTDPQIVAHWPLDLCSVDGSEGEIIDIVGDSHGNTVGDAKAVNAGKLCQAGELSGAGDHLNIPHTDVMDLDSGTISMWVKIPNFSFSNNRDVRGQGLISRDSTGFDNGGHLTIWVANNGRVEVRHQGTNSEYRLTANNRHRLRRDRWHLVTYSFGNQRMRLFIDGILSATNNNFTGGISGNTEPLIIGATARRSGNGESTPSQVRDYLKGEIDDIRLFSNELAAADIKALYDSSDYACENCTGDKPLAFYQFEEPEYTGAGQVTDSSANGQHADPLGNAQTMLPPSNFSCRALDIPQNFTLEEVDAINTKINLDDVGGRGTISFFYRSAEPWIGGNPRQLFDASRVANPPKRNNGKDRYFFLTLLNNGALRFGMEDNRDGDFQLTTARYSVEANRWIHVAIGWDLVNNTARVYLNGYHASYRYSSSIRTSQIAGLGELFIGDIGNNYVIAGGTDNSAYGQFDNVRVYNFMQTQRQVIEDIYANTPCASVHHYEISHPEQALTCSAAEVTIKACLNSDCSQLSTDPSTVQLSGGDFQGGNTVTFTGTTTVKLKQSTPGQAVIGLASANPNASLQCSSADCAVDFVNAGFEFFDTANPTQSLLSPLVAESDLSRLGLRAVRDIGGQCAALLTGTQSIDFSYDCVTESDAPYSPNQCQRPFANVGVSGNGTGANTGTVELTFNAAGEASFSGYSYADAGRLSLTASMVLDGATIDSGRTVLNSVPDKIILGVDSAVDPMIAGAGFTTTMAAVGQNGSVLPGYQPGTMQISAQRVAPAPDGFDGGLSIADGSIVSSDLNPVFSNINGLTFNAGQYSYDQAYYEEVGIIRWDMQDANYLGQRIDADSVEIGRFVPAYFDIANQQEGTLSDSCSAAFTYIGQPFGYEVGQEPQLTISAYNALGGVTNNYADTAWLLQPNINDISFADSSGYGEPNIESSGVLQLSGEDVYDGSATLNITDSLLLYEKLATPAEPFDASVDLTLPVSFFTDPDGVCYQSNYPDGCESLTFDSATGTQQRYGRLHVTNSYGPEDESIFLPLTAEYYVSAGWQENSADNCTAIDLTQAAGDIVVSNASSGENEQDITGLLAETSSDGLLTNGKSDSTDLLLGPPLDSSGDGVRGTIQVTLSTANDPAWSAYLNIDWNADGVIDANDTPTGIATFGILRGNDRTTHWRETFE